MAENKPKKVSRGGMWFRTGNYGDYYSVKVTIGGKEENGRIVGGTDYFFNAYENTYKQEGETTPDFKLFAQEPKKDQTAAPAGPPTKKTSAAKKAAPKAAAVPVPESAENPSEDDDLPF